MSSFHQILRQAKSRIQETDASGAAALLAQGYIILDVREPEEYKQGSVPKALHIPRGILESNIENHIPDYEQPIVVMCASGVGSPSGLYLGAAGIGTLGIIEMDVVDESKLQRQILHNVNRLGARKVDSAKETINSLNPEVDVITYDAQLNAKNVMEILEGYDVVVDGADNFPSRYLLNDASVKLGIPVVHGSIFRFEGQVTVFDPRDGVTYRDMQPQEPVENVVLNCVEAGVLGVLPGIVGSMQALEAIKLILDIGENLSGRLVVFDSLEMTFHEYEIKRDPNNQITWENHDLIEVTEKDQTCASASENQRSVEN